MEQYVIYVGNEDEKEYVGAYDIYGKNRYGYFPTSFPDDIKDRIDDDRLLSEVDSRKPIAFIEEMLDEKYRDTSKKKIIYHYGPYTIIKDSEETGEDFLVYDRGAEKGQNGYSEIDHSCPHCEFGSLTSIDEWTRYYKFNKMSDGTYVAELDEAWYWGGSGLDGGVIHDDVPEEWFELDYDEFLKKILTLAEAGHYGFTVEELKEKKGLKKFFGFEE